MSDGKRFFASLLGIHLSEEPPVMQSLVPKRIANEIMNGKLPKFTPSTILLKQNEICHFMNKAALVVQKKKRCIKVAETEQVIGLQKDSLFILAEVQPNLLNKFGMNIKRELFL